MEIPGYRIERAILETRDAVVWRGQADNGAPVLIRIDLSGTTELERLARCQLALELGRAAGSACALTPRAVLRLREGVALVTDDPGGEPLEAAIPDQGLEIGPLIALALVLARTLERLHAAGLIHRDVRPASFLLPPGAREAFLFCLGTAIRLQRTGEPGGPAPDVEVDLAYAPPELSGCIEGLVSERADLYALGVTMFRMATGVLPFPQSDPVELVHAHIALPAPRLEKMRPELPRVLCRIVARLLAKDPIDRYASAHGLAEDLTACARAFARSGTVRDFPLGERDVSASFRLPERLYGRDRELKRLAAAFRDGPLAGRQTLVTVSGPSGIGKTAFVGQIQLPMAAAGARFHAGKFDQFRTSQPYLAPIEAMRSLLQRELAQPEAVLAARREEVQAAVGEYGRLIADRVPELAQLIGPQPPVPEAPPAEAALRFNGVVARFLRVFARPETPLVIFLDDLQWADPASLGLLVAMAQSSRLDHLMFILGYRSNEMGPGHPARLAIEEMGAAATQTLQIELEPLGPQDVGNLVADTLHDRRPRVDQLAATVHELSGGNPFFVREYLAELHERGLLAFDAERRCWTCDLGALGEAQVPETVAGFLTARLVELPEAALDLLDTASCIGGEFDLGTLARVHQIGQTEAAAGLVPAVESGIVVPIGSGHEVFGSLARAGVSAREADTLGTARYRFRHDQVRLAVHDRLDEARRARRHLQIGRLLVRSLDEEEIASRAVEIFEHISWSAGLIEDPEERLSWAGVGLAAGRSAQQALAFATAHDDLRLAAGLLPPDAWTAHYHLALGIHMTLAECLFALGRIDELEQLSERMLIEIGDPVDAAGIQGLRIRHLATENRYDEAADICVEVARSLGIRLPRHPTTLHVLFGVARALIAQGRKPALAYERLPEIRDRRIRASVTFLVQSTTAAYFAEPNLLPLAGITCTWLSLRHGTTAASSYGFAVWGLVLCGALGWIRRGYDFGELGVRTGRRYGGVHEVRAHFVMDTFVRHWREALPGVADRLLADWSRSRDAGDEEVATYCAGVWLYTEFLAGQRIDSDARMPELVEYIAGSNMPHVKDSFLAWVELLRALRGEQLPEELAGELFDYRRRLHDFEAARNGVLIAISSIAAGVLDHLAGRYDRAERRLARASRWERSIVGQVLVPGLAFLRALNAYRQYEAGLSGRAALRIARWQMRRLRRWAVHQPGTLDYRLAILDAEANIVQGRTGDALLALHRAKELMPADVFFYRALAERRIADLLAAEGQTGEAVAAAQRACAAFEIWGSPAAANALRDGAGHLSARLTEIARRSPASPSRLELDLRSLVNIVGAVATEFDQSALLERLMMGLLQAANADRGVVVLIEEEHRQLVVEIEATIGQAMRMPRVPLDAFPAVARPAIDFVIRACAPLVGNRATEHEVLAGDDHLRAMSVGAVLALPLAVRGRAIGAIYLENHVARHAFTPARIEIADAIAAQAALALENARLYHRLRETLDRQIRQNEAEHRFVPAEILGRLGYRSILEVDLDQAVEVEMTAVFVDIRGFTAISETLGPQGTIGLVNRYLSHIQPGIAAQGGFVGNYLGDGLLALFPGTADSALHGAIAMVQGLYGYNRDRGELPRLRFGIGVDTGPVTIGMIGDPDHIQCAVLGDTVNTAARIQELTRDIDARVLVSGRTVERLAAPGRFPLRPVGEVAIRGRAHPVWIHECVTRPDDEPPAPPVAISGEARRDILT